MHWITVLLFFVALPTDLLVETLQGQSRRSGKNHFYPMRAKVKTLEEKDILDPAIMVAQDMDAYEWQIVKGESSNIIHVHILHGDGHVRPVGTISPGSIDTPEKIRGQEGVIYYSIPKNSNITLFSGNAIPPSMMKITKYFWISGQNLKGVAR